MMCEQPLCFGCEGETLVGVLSLPENARPQTGVLIIVGGPQYRVGSHRQFVLLARYLAAAGIPVLRFDVRGMGDSSGEAREFTEINDDIAAAISAFQQACPSLQGVVLWGLCDAASAALLYWQQSRDVRLRGMVLLNPWVRSEAGLARTRVRHYYRGRLLQAAFWKKMLSGKMALRASLRDGWRNWRLARQGVAGAEGGTFQSRMALALREFPGPILFLLSGKDLTGQEFNDWASAEYAGMDWRQRPAWQCRVLAEADHTFSRGDWQREVEAATGEWLLQRVGPGFPEASVKDTLLSS